MHAYVYVSTYVCVCMFVCVRLCAFFHEYVTFLAQSLTVVSTFRDLFPEALYVLSCVSVRWFRDKLDTGVDIEFNFMVCARQRVVRIS